MLLCPEADADDAAAAARISAELMELRSQFVAKLPGELASREASVSDVVMKFNEVCLWSDAEGQGKHMHLSHIVNAARQQRHL